MKKQPKTYSILIIILVFVVNACAGAQTEVSPTDPPASPTPTETPLPEPTATATKKEPSGPIATAMALAAQTTLVPPTPVGGVSSVDIAADDYVGIFKQAWGIVEAEYVRDNYNGVDWDAVYDEYLPMAEQVQSSEELHALLTDLIRELGDSHSRFVPPNRMQAEFGVGSSEGEPRPWTGIQIWPGPGREDKFLSAWYVCEISPAAFAGIERGDLILAVDGEDVAPGPDGIIDSSFVSGAVFGTGGDSVTLTIQSGPNESPRDVTVELGGAGGCDDWRHMIVNEAPRIGYIRVPDFDGNAGSNILNAIRDMEEDAPLEGLILDVRHNPGGNSDDSAGIFADGIVGTEGPLREGKQRTIYRIRGVDWNDTIPLVVLTDGSSHSAADYFPAAMKELDRATIIGVNSAGNTEGIISRSLADGTLIRLAVTTLLLNDGTSLEGVGVTPHVYVPLGQWGLKQKPYDVQLQAAIDYLLGQ
ncbi:MAG: S41 family peptidase [Anaerolineales bacterium]|nr:S41 family peptidase [Anaerolineales bacterium]